MLTVGTRLGPYEIAAPLGAGGMGEVYRARDTRLGREVAIKILPEHLSGSADLRARFEREARTVSSLNHPHICVLHDIGREGETDYLVMELVEGETLATRLARGALPTPDVLRLGSQIAEALERAHRAGVVHRDLKPGNIMLTRAGAKLMDFGLARSAAVTEAPGGAASQSPTLAQSPTLTQPLTAEGALVGTFQYMSPEQLEGKEADARSDLWALGCVLYEMATGRHAFEGKSQASLIGAIMNAEPAPMSQLAPLAPPALERLVRGCLAKEPEDRLQTAHDVRLHLQWIAEGGSQAGLPAPVAARRRTRERLAWAIAVAGVAAALALAVVVMRSRGREPEAVRATLAPPATARLGFYSCNVVLSPDGRTVAFVAGDSLGINALWVRPLGATSARRVSEDVDANWPFWSPDGTELAYFTVQEGKLKKVALAGGSPTVICSAPNGRGGAWGRDGTILFAPAPDGPLMRVSAGGGEPVGVTELDPARNETAHRFPCFLPDGEHFLYASLPAKPGGWDIHVGSLRSGAGPRLLTARSAAVYAEPGYLLFERDGRVLAQRFDPRARRLEGDAQPIDDAPTPSDLDAEPVASASRDGRLVMLRNEPPNTRLELLDAAGNLRRVVSLPAAPWAVARMAPDGRRAAVLNGPQIWVVDLERSVPMQFAATNSSAPTVAWSPDGARLAFVTRHEGREEIHIAGMDGRAEMIPTAGDEFKSVEDWSPDGRHVVFGVLTAETAWDLWLLPTTGDRKPIPYLSGPGWELNGRVSPDGRWLVYQSNETGSAEVYIQSFPRPGQKIRVSPDGGAFPGWRRDGRAVIYARGATVLSVPVEGSGELRLGTPRPVFTFRRNLTGADRVGDGWLVSTPNVALPPDIRLVLNWPALLK